MCSLYAWSAAPLRASHSRALRERRIDVSLSGALRAPVGVRFRMDLF
jgi:hypothetical protein